MARPTSISKEQIIEAARALFLEEGPTVSTLAIAKRAGVSEGSIFKRFATKEELFSEAMGMADLELAQRLEPRIGTGDVREHLVELSIEVIDLFRELLPRVMMLWTTQKTSLVEFCRDHPKKMVRTITRYLEREASLGRIDTPNPELLARTFLGALHHYAFFELIGDEGKELPDAATYARDLVDMLWCGVAAQKEDA